MNYGKVYDENVAATYDRDDLGLLSGVRDLALAQVNAVALPVNATILDLGVGTGATLAALDARFRQSRKIGIDLSAKMIEIAKSRVDFEAHVDDASNAAAHVAPATVDLAVAHFLTTFVDRPKFFRTVRDLLKPTGIFSVVSSTSEAFPRVRFGVDQLLGHSGLADAVSPSPASSASLIAELNASGFDVLKQDVFRRAITFETFQSALTWGTQSGFFAHSLEALGADKIAALAERAKGLFPFADEYVGHALLLAPRGRQQ